MIKVYVSRFNKETDSEPHLECYKIEMTPQMKVLDALQAINDKYDEDISFRSSCRAGQCGSCGILFNGNGALACQKDIKDGAIIEPLKFPIVKDLIVDKSSIENKVKDLQLTLDNQHTNGLDNRLTKDNIKETKKVRSCIECYSCLSTCPVVNMVYCARHPSNISLGLVKIFLKSEVLMVILLRRSMPFWFACSTTGS